MNHQHHGDHHHPETFDEVIARGFPHDQLEALEEAHRVRRAERRFELAAPLALQAATATPLVRKNQSALSAAAQTAFRNAVSWLVTDGSYERLVRIHMDMSHNMHGTMGATGLYRFLGWHRRYLVAFERELQRADAALRPTATDRIGVPYWSWPDPFPAWLNNFLPAKDPASGHAPPARKNAAPPAKASRADIDIIVNQFAIQDPRLPNQNDYTKFTYGLEGWGQRRDGSKLPAHNHGHAWVGGIMNNTSSSPTDPIFWLHHAEVDRLWEIWRQTHPAPAPLLTGSNLVMDPWAESYTNLLNISALGYRYDSLTI